MLYDLEKVFSCNPEEIVELEREIKKDTEKKMIHSMFCIEKEKYKDVISDDELKSAINLALMLDWDVEQVVETCFRKGDNMNNKNDKLAIDFSCESKRPVSEEDKDLVERHKNVCDMLNTIYAQKNKAYGDSFGETYRELGIISAVTRISDKFNRLKTLAKNAEIDKGDEAIEDTLLDLANYCIMTYMELKKE